MTGAISRQPRHDFRAADVAGVDDVLDAGERLQRLGAQQAVGVGDDADQHEWFELWSRYVFAVEPALIQDFDGEDRRQAAGPPPVRVWPSARPRYQGPASQPSLPAS